MPAFLRRMFGVGKLSDELRQQVEAEGVIDIAENLAVVLRFSGSVPGRFSASSTWRSAGALALTSQRAVATLGVRSDPAARAVDCPWDAVEPKAMKVEISADGMKVDIDLHRVNPGFQGHLSLHYKYEVPADVVTRLPRTSLRANVSPEFVYLALGVRADHP